MRMFEGMTNWNANDSLFICFSLTSEKTVFGVIIRETHFRQTLCVHMNQQMDHSVACQVKECAVQARSAACSCIALNMHGSSTVLAPRVKLLT